MRTTQKYWLCIPHEQNILWCLSFHSYQVWDNNLLTLICSRFKVGTNSALSEWDSKLFLLRSKSNIVSTEGDRGEATAATIHCVFQLTGAQLWGVPAQAGLVRPVQNMAALLAQCVSTWQVSPAPWCCPFLSKWYIRKGFSIRRKRLAESMSCKGPESLNLSGHCCAFPEATWKTFLVPSAYGKSAQHD